MQRTKPKLGADAQGLAWTSSSPARDTSVARLTVNRHGVVEGKNRSADRLLRTNDGIWEQNGQLTAWNAGCCARLSRAIAAACDDQPKTGALVIDRRSGLLGFQVVVTPFGSADGAALVSITDPCDDGPDYAQILKSAYNLTGAEAAVAALVVQGSDVRQVAELREVSPFTVRTLLKRGFAKIGVTRQVDLVRLLLSGAFAHLGSRAGDTVDLRS
ncbi:MAG: DNA-binding CsgD family transcriptional regulator [Myxococcota bacterium]|jgi:DNA-binding CsgD family transcriptional regulator